jgi:hypothetical protein
MGNSDNSDDNMGRHGWPWLSQALEKQLPLGAETLEGGRIYLRAGFWKTELLPTL